MVPGPEVAALQNHSNSNHSNNNNNNLNLNHHSNFDDSEHTHQDDQTNSDRGHDSPRNDAPDQKHDPEEAAFWIPQATADGRLFYYNTLTGFSTMELPLESPTSANESGPRDRSNFFVPDSSRPPPELMARGIDRYEDDYDGSASDAEGDSLFLPSHDSMSRRRRQSFLSDGVSPATSLDSVNPSPIAKANSSSNNLSHHHNHHARNDSLASPKSIPIMAGTGTPGSFHSNTDRIGALSISASVPRHFLDSNTTTTTTWSSLVENMRSAVDAYRQAVLDENRSQYVSRAEDISDHLRMLLAAGSDTTDNHSGNPSIISTNKSLYPHFRDMMSKFSKLVLSSHIAAADWPAADSANKCLHEADGVLNGVYGYVSVARQQKGEDIRRLVPGFVARSPTGGHWQDNNISQKNDQTSSSSFLDQGATHVQPAVPLDSPLLERVDELRKMLASSSRRLEEQLSVKDRVIDSNRHDEISDAVCAAGAQIVERFRPWISLVESINLAPMGSNFQNPQMADFSVQKQRVYDGIADLVLCCQSVSSPLSDEWAELRTDPLDARLNHVRSASRQLDKYMSQIGFSLSLLMEQSPPNEAESNGNPGPHANGGSPHKGSQRLRADSDVRRIAPESIGIPSSYPLDEETLLEKPQRNIDKAQRFFGQPVPRENAVREPEETPFFLKLDHEGEVFYDTKSDVPQLKCGTLAGLVEQLTRHDKLDPSFKDTFLLTYQSFTTASELFEMLVHRFTLQPPFNLNKQELQTWTEQKQVPIRIRVVNILKSWFENYWMEPNDDESMRLLGRIHAFVKDTVSTTKIPGTSQLLSLLDQRMRGLDTTAKRLVPTVNPNAPTPITPKNMKKIKFLDIDPTEFARQLTIIESRLYAKIKPSECLNKTWQKKLVPDEPDPAANVKALILHSNQLTNWVAEMILTQSDVKRRVVVIKHFVSVADVSKPYNAVLSIPSTFAC